MKVIKKVLFIATIAISGFLIVSCENENIDTPTSVSGVNELKATQSDRLLQRRAKDWNVPMYCQCTHYIKFRINYPGSGEPTNHANLMDNWLISKGYSSVPFSVNNLPRNKDVIQFKNGAHGTDQTYGHVGMVATAYRNGNNIYVEVVGANQGGSQWTEYGCNNVSMMYISALKTNGDVVIWRK